jgi:hypothetical protein
LAAAAVIFAGCGSSHDTVIVDPGPELISLFLIDDFGIGADHVPYTCVAPDGTVSADDFTTLEGEFVFTAGERCTFDLFGFAGTVPFYDEPLFIVDDIGVGKPDIPYICDNGIDITDSRTEYDGYFDYPADAFCKFYF